jgi:CRP-like cAMP-binding protein
MSLLVENDSDVVVDIEYLERLSFLGALSADQLVKIWPHISIKEFASGDHIFSQGDLPKAIYVVVSGRVDLVIEANDVHRIAENYQAGEAFGEVSFIGIQPQMGSAIAAGQDVIQCLELDRNGLMALQSEDVDLFSMLILNLARDLSRKYQSHLLEPA